MTSVGNIFGMYCRHREIGAVAEWLPLDCIQDQGATTICARQRGKEEHMHEEHDKGTDKTTVIGTGRRTRGRKDTNDTNTRMGVDMRRAVMDNTSTNTHNDMPKGSFEEYVILG
jgi:hypothetical protein